MTSRLNDGNKFLTEKLSKYPNNPKLLRFKCFRSLIDGNFDKFSDFLSKNDHVNTYKPDNDNQQYIKAYNKWKIELKTLLNK